MSRSCSGAWRSPSRLLSPSPPPVGSPAAAPAAKPAPAPAPRPAGARGPPPETVTCRRAPPNAFETGSRPTIKGDWARPLVTSTGTSRPAPRPRNYRWAAVLPRRGSGEPGLHARPPSPTWSRWPRIGSRRRCSPGAQGARGVARDRCRSMRTWSSRAALRHRLRPGARRGQRFRRVLPRARGLPEDGPAGAIATSIGSSRTASTTSAPARSSHPPAAAKGLERTRFSSRSTAWPRTPRPPRTIRNDARLNLARLYYEDKDYEKALYYDSVELAAAQSRPRRDLPGARLGPLPHGAGRSRLRLSHRAGCPELPGPVPAREVPAARADLQGVPLPLGQARGARVSRRFHSTLRHQGARRSRTGPTLSRPPWRSSAARGRAAT